MMSWQQLTEKFNGAFTLGRNLMVLSGAVAAFAYAALAHDNAHKTLAQTQKEQGRTVELVARAVVGIEALVEYDLNETVAKLEQTEDFCKLGKLKADSEDCQLVEKRLGRARNRVRERERIVRDAETGK
jgi:hypothetical protein